MTRWIVIALLAGSLYQFFQQNPELTEKFQAFLPASIDASSSQSEADDGRIIAEAFERELNNVQIVGSGTVVRILADDTKGSRHQKFILKLDSGQTLLVAHNIDLAPRIPDLETGDSVGFYGEYEWNANGGVLHWTHHDPAARHVGGWLEHRGRRYQ